MYVCVSVYVCENCEFQVLLKPERKSQHVTKIGFLKTKQKQTTTTKKTKNFKEKIRVRGQGSVTVLKLTLGPIQV